jgi:hypothetical protein
MAVKSWFTKNERQLEYFMTIVLFVLFIRLGGLSEETGDGPYRANLE